jgi:beta-galactosidase
VWEWRDHGLLTHAADGTPYYGYGGDFGEVVHDGNFVMDGMVLPNDDPTPGLAEFATVSQPVIMGLDGGALTVRNRYHTIDTGHLRFVARRELDGRMVEDSVLVVPPVAAGETGSVALPDELLASAGDGETWLTVTAELAADTAWAPVGHMVATAQFDRSSAPVGAATPVAGGQVVSARNDGTLAVGPGVFDAASGQLRSLYGVPVGGPRLELWRGPTDNDRSEMRGSFELGDPDETDGEGAPGPSSERRWRERGLDRLTQRLLSVETSGSSLAVRVRSAAAAGVLFVDTTCTWTATADGELALRVEVNPSPAWDCTWPRVGVRLDLPTDVDRAAWFGTGPFESYPDTNHAARIGRFAAGIDDLNVVYSRPQETGHRADVRELELSDASGPRLRLRSVAGPGGRRPGFTLTRHLPQELDRAAHPYQLPTPNHSYLFLDAAVHGVGSRACGIDVLPQHALWPGAQRFDVVFSDPAG